MFFLDMWFAKARNNCSDWLRGEILRVVVGPTSARSWQDTRNWGTWVLYQNLKKELFSFISLVPWHCIHSMGLDIHSIIVMHIPRYCWLFAAWASPNLSFSKCHDTVADLRRQCCTWWKVTQQAARLGGDSFCCGFIKRIIKIMMKKTIPLISPQKNVIVWLLLVAFLYFVTRF